MTPEQRAELREWYRMATDSGDSPRSRAQAQAELWNRLTCEGWQRPAASIRAGEGLLPALLDAADRADALQAEFTAEAERHAITARKLAEAEKLRDAAVAQWERIEGEFHGLRQELKAAKAECEALRLRVSQLTDDTIVKMAEALRALDGGA